MDEKVRDALRAKAESMGLTLSAFLRFAAIEYRTGAPLLPNTKAPRTPEGDQYGKESDR